ncbi:MAG: type II toxin-antitoxin system PemK/MazF family toxin [Clostridia bacterium]|nr:type II toxin-antitoxin system PemK/MazF family toxin [Clostridia bacterium]
MWYNINIKCFNYRLIICYDENKCLQKECDITNKIVSPKTRKPKTIKEESAVLQLQVSNIDICRISQILVKYNIKASISNSHITLEGDISNELLTKICGESEMEIRSIQNFVREDISDFLMPVFVQQPEFDLLYPKVKFGELYLCDFGDPYEHELGFIRYAIIVQNNYGNESSSTTIVVPCTTKNKRFFSTNYYTTFSSDNMIDYDIKKVGTKENVIKIEQIRAVDKSRLRKYLGTLKPELMSEILEKIHENMQLNEDSNNVDYKKVYISRKKEPARYRKDLNMTQIQILSRVEIKKLIEISDSNLEDENKVEKILELFGFNLNQKGVKLLAKAILASPKDEYFNIETLSEIVSRDEVISREEVKRLIIARVKETFGFSKAPTIDFIRVINAFLTKQEENKDEETSF